MSSADQPLDEQPTRRRPPNSSLGQIHDDVIKCGLDLRDVKRAQEQHTTHFERIEDILAQQTTRFERIDDTLAQHTAYFDGLDQKIDLVVERLGPGNGGS